LDPRSIYDFPIKWIKGFGLDVAGDEAHSAYIIEMCNTALTTLKNKITEVAAPTTSVLKLLDGLYQEIIWHTHYATSKLKNFYVSFIILYRSSYFRLKNSKCSLQTW